ncbi:MAG: double-strand break repair protein AddB [Pseudomonadota bacterium]
MTLYSATTHKNFDAPTAHLYSITAGSPFLRTLADGIIDRYGADPIDLADITVYVPTRRAARALAEAFLDVVTAKKRLKERDTSATLLPQIRTLGEVDLTEAEFSSNSELSDPEGTLAPAASLALRQLTLARLVAAKDKAFTGAENWPAALAAAGELAKLLDSLYTEEIPFTRLKNLVPTEHAAHWEQSLAFLNIITEAWPAYLSAAGLTDPSARRMALVDLQNKIWQKTLPKGPVIIAGSTGSAPAVSRLMKTITQLPKGAVVLPGLDRSLDLRAWETIDDAHPQAGMKYLLETLQHTIEGDLQKGTSPKEIQQWHEEPNNASASREARTSLISLALRPADATDEWQHRTAKLIERDPELTEALSGVRLIEAEEEEDEATAIALLFRETLETENKTALLVTPDRFLARRIALKMQRWGVDLDDSAGTPFSSSPCGAFLRVTAQWLSHPHDPVRALALVRHPLAGFSLDNDGRQRSIDAFDIGMRGVAPAVHTLNGGAQKSLVDILRTKLEFAYGDNGPRGQQQVSLDASNAIVHALDIASVDWPRQPQAPLGDLLIAHLKAAEAIAATADMAGAEALWRGEDGTAGAAFLSDLRVNLTESAVGDMRLPIRDYPAAFMGLIASCAVRRRRPAHPRLAILGPLEARLQHADLMILGGLNEGVWPADAGSDPFMSRQMRKEAGLPSPERRLGLAAHDFSQLSAHPHIVLTRSKKSGGDPTKPSRWLVRLKTILDVAAPKTDIDITDVYAMWAAALDDGGIPTPARRPAPTPPVTARPRALAVTRIDKWLRDPYGIYARYILRLFKMDPPGETFGSREMGNLLHTLFEVASASDAPLHAEELMKQFKSSATLYGCTRSDFTLWRYALERAFDWFVEFETTRRYHIKETFYEEKGEIELAQVTPPFRLNGRADRIDVLQDGSIDIIDYKSGALKSDKQAKHFNPQLQLLGLIAERGGFKSLGTPQVEAYQYVRMLNRKDGSSDNERGKAGDAARAAIREAEEKLIELIKAFDNPSRGYVAQPHPEFTDTHGDYDQLSRRGEWGALGDNDGGES